MAACVAQALDTLHRECQVLYRNFLPEHIQLLDSGYIALMDMRMAKRNDCTCTTLCGSPGYVSPEMVRGEVQTNATDWWSFGVMLFEVAEGELPWEQNGNDDIRILSQAPLLAVTCRHAQSRALVEAVGAGVTAALAVDALVVGRVVMPPQLARRVNARLWTRTPTRGTPLT